MGRLMPTECDHGKIIDAGDFDATIEYCWHCHNEIIFDIEVEGDLCLEDLALLRKNASY